MTMSPEVVAIALSFIGAFFVVIAPLRYAPLLLICFGILVPMRAHLVIGGLDFFSVRILAYAALLKFFLAKRQANFKFNQIDKVFFAFFLVRTIVNLISVRTGETILHPIAIMVDAMGIYLLTRIVFQSLEDFSYYHKALAYLCILLGSIMLFERLFEINIFTTLGGRFPAYRAGVVRANGPFSHSILAGTFGAVLIPIFLALRSNRRGASRFLFSAGIAGALLMVGTTQSSGPLFALITGVVAYFGMWRFRKKLRLIGWTAFLTLVALHFSMKAPVWSLINRVPLVSGSQSYHRYKLIDNFIVNWREWILVGTDSFSEWGYFMFDLSNMYVATGTQSGLLGLTLFIVLLARLFQEIGRLAALARERDNRQLEIFSWGLGCCFAAHAVSFIGVVYWDQMQLLFYMQTALVATLMGLRLGDVGQLSRSVERDDSVSGSRRVVYEKAHESSVSGTVARL